MARVFVTGITGNIGRALLAELQRRGDEVTALVRRKIKIPDCRVVVGDLTDIAEARRALRKADHVIHLASPRSDDRELVVLADVLGTGRLLDLWQHGNFVYVSSSTVYGIPGSDSLGEGTTFDAVNWYDLGKVVNEFQLRLTPEGGERRAAISLRPALVFSTGVRRNDRQFLSIMYRACRQGVEFAVDSEEGLKDYGCSFVGEVDMAWAIAESLSLGESNAYNIAGGFCTWHELVETINQAAGTSSRCVVREPDPKDDSTVRLPQSRTQLDVAAFEAATNFQARETLEDLVGRFVERESATTAKSG